MVRGQLRAEAILIMEEDVNELLKALIPATAALMGVALGGWLTLRNQRQERRHSRVREQLEQFYSPLLSLRETIRSKTLTMAGLADAAKAALIENPRPALRDSDDNPVSPVLPEEFEAILDYQHRQFADELLPLYAKMLTIFSDHYWLAEPSTRAHHNALAYFVEIWEQTVKGNVPAAVVEGLSHSEASLLPLDRDLLQQLERLRSELKK